MLGLGNNQENRFEALRRQVEGRSGGFDIMRLRFTIVRQGLINAENSPTIARAHDNIRRAQVLADEMAYRDEVKRLAEVAELESAVVAAEGVSPHEAEVEALKAQHNLEAVPGSGLGLGDQATMLQQAQANVNRIHSDQTPSHNYPLPS